MAYQIKRIQGKVKKETGDEVIMIADEKNVFEIHKWENQTNITWRLEDKAKNILFTKTCKPEEKIILGINKKLSGHYRYYLYAQASVALVESLKIGGYCPEKIIKASWASEGKEKADLTCGEIFDVKLEAEGLNGSIVDVEIYGRHNDRFIIKKTVECIEGDIVVSFAQSDTLNWPSTIFKIPEVIPEKTELYIKVKHKSLYVKDNSGSDEVCKLNLITKPLITPRLPRTNNVLTVKSSSEKAKNIDNLVSGIVELEKIKILNTTLANTHVCNDYIKDWSSKYSDLWLLNSVADPYHWLKTRTGDDRKKPDPLPITFSRNKNLNFQAGFKCLFPFDKIYIKVIDNEKKCVYADKPVTAKSKDATFTLTFTTTSPPFNTIRYIDNFELSFFYSLDNQTWTLFKKTTFCLYVTWNAPKFAQFQDKSSILTDPRISALPPATQTIYRDFVNKTTLQIKDGAQKFICESMLYLGCMRADNGVFTTQEAIALKIFEEFKKPNLIVYRRRENYNIRPTGGNYLPLTDIFGLGYWRQESAHPAFYRTIPGTSATPEDFETYRSLRYLLAYGVARCGEFTNFFGHLLLAQGLNHLANGQIGICTRNMASNFSEYKFEATRTKAPAHINSISFAVKNAKQNDLTNHSHSVGTSRGQGNPIAQPVFGDHVLFYYNKKLFLDPSYGKSYTAVESKLSHYCKDCLNSIYIVDTSTATPSIIDIDIHNYIKSDQQKF